MTRRTVFASAGLALIGGAGFAILVHTVGEQRDSAALRRAEAKAGVR